MHDIRLAMARNYSENLREEVKKGMSEKASQGTYPGRAPFGYRNNRGARTIEIHPEKSPIAVHVFELYASGRYSLLSLSKELRHIRGTFISKANLHKMLNNPFYIGRFEWSGQTYQGTHPTLISPELYARAQAVLNGHHKPKYGKHEIAFRGMLTCAHDDCTVTAELKTERNAHCPGSVKGKSPREWGTSSGMCPSRKRLCRASQHPWSVCTSSCARMQPMNVRALSVNSRPFTHAWMRPIWTNWTERSARNSGSASNVIGKRKNSGFNRLFRVPAKIKPASGCSICSGF